jgi:integrase
VPPGHNPCGKIKRQRLKIGNIGIYEPTHVKQIMDRVREDLIPFLATWFFIGARKDEIARLRWSQIRSALQTGYLYIEPEQGRKTGPRSPKLLPNLRAWFEWYLQHNPDAAGFVLPRKYTEGRNLDEITKKISRPRTTSETCAVIIRTWAALENTSPINIFLNKTPTVFGGIIQIGFNIR